MGGYHGRTGDGLEVMAVQHLALELRQERQPHHQQRIRPVREEHVPYGVDGARGERSARPKIAVTSLEYLLLATMSDQNTLKSYVLR